MRVAPPAPIVEVHTAAPSPRHVWIAGFHRWDGKAYVWVAGHWSHHSAQGWYWVDGHWKR